MLLSLRTVPITLDPCYVRLNFRKKQKKVSFNETPSGCYCWIHFDFWSLTSPVFMLMWLFPRPEALWYNIYEKNTDRYTKPRLSRWPSVNAKYPIDNREYCFVLLLLTNEIWILSHRKHIRLSKIWTKYSFQIIMKLSYEISGNEIWSSDNFFLCVTLLLGRFYPDAY